MSNAVSIEPTAPGGGVAAASQGFHHAADAADGTKRRISADSFKLLTAKLKNGHAAAPKVAPEIPDILPERVPPAVPESTRHAIPEVLAEPVSQPDPPLGEAAVPEPVVREPPRLEAPLAEAGAEHLALAPEALPALELPTFRPLQWNEPENEPEEVRESAPDLADEAVTEAQDSTPVEAFDTVAPDADIPAQLDLPSFQPIDAPATVVALEDAAAADVVDTFVTELPEPAVEADSPEPEIAQSNEAAIDDRVIEAADSPVDLFADATAEIAEETDEAISLQQKESIAPSLASDVADVETVPEAAEVLELRADVTPEETSQTSLPADAPVPMPETEAADILIEPEPAVASEAETASLAPTQESKGPTSEMAGRVVEAMMKTISTAIYSKPSVSERAAFLREVAVLMQEAVSSGETTASAPAGVPPDLPPSDIRQINLPAREPDTEETSVAQVLAERIGPSAAPLLKTAKSATDDPFSGRAVSSRSPEPKPLEAADADEESGELALTLLDMMSGGTGSLPHERTLAADTLLRILPRIPVKQLLSVVERVAIMEAPPALLVAKLIRDTRAEIVAPLLERCSHISDQDLMNAAPDGDAPKLRMIARRRVLSTVLSDYLISTGEPGVLLTLIRNPGAALSHEAFFKLSEHAHHHHGLLAPLTTRADLPPPVAFELFWHVPPELRRFIFSRFLTDSETLNRILKITRATHDSEATESTSENKFPPREAVEHAVAQAAAFRVDEAAQAFADMGSIDKATAFRILSDAEGEPVTVLLKALGCTRARFEEALTRLRMSEAGVLRQDRNPEELQAIFDGLSFNKARILLTYWDWFMRQAGPYAPHN